MSDQLARYSSAWWTEWANVGFTITKIFGIVIAGAWTYYQWDKVIFPMESHEQFIRKAELRTDIDPSQTRVEFTPERDLSLPILHKGDVLSVSGTIALRNDRSFPIRVEFTESLYQIDHPLKDLVAVASTGTASLKATSPSKVLESEFASKIIQTLSGNSLTIEPNATVRLAISEFIYLDKKKDNNFFGISFILKYTLTSIDPISNIEINIASKYKWLIVTRNFYYEHKKINDQVSNDCVGISKECQAVARANATEYARLEPYQSSDNRPYFVSAASAPSIYEQLAQ
jgi:hypothetical protein